VRTRHLIALGLAAVSLAAAGCDEEESGLQKDEAAKEAGGSNELAQTEAQAPPETSGALKDKPKITVPETPAPKELQIKDLVKGEGATAKAGSQISVNYSGVAYSTGKEFDNSYDRGQPFDLQLGAGMVIPGWDQGIEGMKVGGRRQLTIPSDLAYGPQGSPPDIKGGETLIFVVDLLGVQ
jgi:peptidylprolyl isomerase